MVVSLSTSRTELVPAYVRLLRDNEAEVRIAAAGKVTKFCGIVSPQVAQQHILPCVKVCYILCSEFGNLIVSISDVVNICVSEDLTHSMWTMLQELSTDSSQHVRAALASVIMGMAPLLGKVGYLLYLLIFA